MSLLQFADDALDPFSEVIATLGTRNVRGTTLEASGEWALTFDGRTRLKFVAVTRGQCWLLLPDRPPETLAKGDVVLISNTLYTVASNPAVPPVDGMSFFARPGQDMLRIGSGDEVATIGGGSSFSESGTRFVLEALPTFLRVDRQSAAIDAVSRALRALQAEVGSQNLGRSLVMERLAEILLVEALRACLAPKQGTPTSWIMALADPKIGKSLSLLHANIARRWTVPVLAAEVGMSRSAFTQRFVEMVGYPPMGYLTRWRMLLAQRKLATGQTVATVAAEVGYGSQSAFTQAFKRTIGRTPRSRDV